MRYVGLSEIARREKLVRIAAGVLVWGAGVTLIGVAYEFGFLFAGLAGGTLIAAASIYLFASIWLRH